MRYALTCLYFFLGWLAVLPAQTVTLQWQASQDQTSLADLPVALPDSVDAAILNDTLRQLIAQLHDQSYLEASLEQIDQEGKTYSIRLHLGPAYQWSYLDLSAVPPLLQEVLPRRDFTDRPFRHDEIAQLFERMLQHAENHGHPFAAIRLDSIGLQEGAIVARVEVALNQAIRIEAIRIDGSLNISMPYLTQYLDIRPGDLFCKEKLIRAQELLQTIPFAVSYQDLNVSFLGNGATINLYLNRKNANRFDILLGLLPSPAENQRFQLTGNVNVDLYNQFGGGERLQADFESLQPGIQDLELSLQYPFIFNWPFGTDLHFQLYKRDSTYIDLIYEVGMQYLLRNNAYIKFFTEGINTNLLTVDTARIKRERRLPSFLDVRQNLFGAELYLERLNFRLNPRRGYQLTLRGSAGTKKISPNQTIVNLRASESPGFDYSTLYDALDLNSFQYRLLGQIAWYLPLFRQSTLKLASRTAAVGSGQPLYQNELYRIGGSRNLRGFNEESIFASMYSMLTMEYRLLFNQTSNIFVFTDLAYVEAKTEQDFDADRLVGVGVGLNLQTAVGVFNISYALGGRKNLPLSFQSGRIHFGMVAGF